MSGQSRAVFVLSRSGPAAHIAGLAAIEATVAALLPRLGRADRDVRPFPDLLLGELAPQLLAPMRAVLHSGDAPRISGSHVLRVLPLWLRAAADAGLGADLVLPAPPVAGLDRGKPAANMHFLRLTRWLLVATEALACKTLHGGITIRIAPRAAGAALPDEAREPMLYGLAVGFARAFDGDAGGGLPMLDHHLEVLAKLLRALPVLAQPRLARDMTVDVLGWVTDEILTLCRATGWNEGLAYVVALNEWQLSVYRAKRQRYSFEGRVLRRMMVRPGKLMLAHVVFAVLNGLAKLPVLSGRRRMKLGVSAAKRDPARLARDWTGPRYDNGTRHGPVFDLPRFVGVDPALARDTQPVHAAEPRLALHIHAFYTEEFAEIVDWVGLWADAATGLFVTCPARAEAEVRMILAGAGLHATVAVVENRGRDVRPLFVVLPAIVASGADVVLKLHTKRSQHRRDGALWRRQALLALASPWAVRTVKRQFAQQPTLGVVAASEQIFRVRDLTGRNEAHLRAMAARLGIAYRAALDDIFVAGTMFFARTQLLAGFAEAVDDAAFEAEAGQLDGTYAHALERMFVAFAHARGWAAQCTDRRDLTAALHRMRPDGTGQSADGGHAENG